jgi:putative oxidoreductase
LKASISPNQCTPARRLDGRGEHFPCSIIPVLLCEMPPVFMVDALSLSAATRYESSIKNLGEMNMDETLKAWTPRALSLLRIIAGLMILQHGMAKLIGFPAVPAFANLQPLSLLWVAGIIELIGGTLLILGLFTRPAAFILSGEMAVAYFMAHATKGFYPLQNGGTLAIMYCFAFLYLSTAGAGPWSLDAAMKKD